MKEAFTKIKEAISNIHRVVKTDEDLEWNRAIYKCSTIVSEVEAEFEKDVCEWEGFDNSLIKNKVIWTYKTSCKKWCIPEEHTDKHFQFCPYCGKKIKAVE